MRRFGNISNQEKLLKNKHSREAAANNIVNLNFYETHPSFNL